VRPGGALFLAAWAHLRRPSETDRLWLEAKLSAAQPLGGAGIAAMGLLALARKDLVQARLWLESLDSVLERAIPPLCAKVAREWRAAEAATRGAWSEVADIAAHRPLSRATRLLGAVADRRLGRGTGYDLWLRWLLAPRRSALRPLVDDALAVPPPPVAAKDDAGPPYRTAAASAPDPMEVALRLHAELLARPSAERLAAAVAAWERGLGSNGLYLYLQARLASLKSNASPADIAATFTAGLTTDLAQLAATSLLPVPELGALSQAVRMELRRALLARIESFAAALEARVSAGRIHAAAEEWSAFLALRRAYEQAGALAGREAQRLVYARVHDALCPLAVTLWNQRQEHPLANAMFRWLLAEARATEHANLVPHEEKNARCTF